MNLSFDDIYLGYAVISAMVIFLLKAFFNTWLDYQRRKRKSESVIDLLLWYAIYEKETPLSNEDEVKKAIEKGNRYEDPNYKPYIIYSENNDLSFAEIREIHEHLCEKGRQKLLDYYIAEEDRSTVAKVINSEYARSFTKERTKNLWETYLDSDRDVRGASEDLIQFLEEAKEEIKLPIRKRVKRSLIKSSTEFRRRIFRY